MLARRIFTFIVAVLALQGGNSRPSVVHIVGLDYPRLAHLASTQGTVEFLLSIGREGTVHSVKLLSGDGLLADSAAKTLTSWTFSPCKGERGECEYPMSVRFVLVGSPVNISECKTEFQFDNPGRIVVTSQYARAIVD